jgi:CRP/FNR family transcriptional activator FtrB
MRRSEREAIRSLLLFREVAEPHFNALMQAALLQQFPAHVVLIRENELPDFLHVVVDGTVELFAGYQGRETTIDIIRPVTTFILAAVVLDAVYLKSARTLSPARILMIPAAAIRDVFSRDAAFARATVTELALRYRGLVRALKNEKLRTSAERVANWVLCADRDQGGNGVIDLTYEKRTIASRLGMTPENLSRTLAILARHGLRTRGRTIAISDRIALERFAKPDPLIDA